MTFSDYSPAPDPSLGGCYEDDGLYCGNGAKCASVIAPPATEGCYFDESCGSGSYCELGDTTTVCRPLITPGGACELSQTCMPGYACIDGVCAAEPFVSEATCLGFPPMPRL